MRSSPSEDEILTLSLFYFCPVRLKIGDYYFNQGKFDKVANGYGKVVRTEKLKIELDKGISND
jgi:hypothetical protein